MAEVLDVATYILQRQGRMSPMKLQKLVYYAQVWSVVEDGRQLFLDTIKAWKQGPVVPALFHAHKGRARIDAAAIGGNSAALTEAERKRIDEVLGFYGSLPAVYLSDLTHHERPWQQAREVGERHGHASPAITLQAIRSFYAGKTPQALNASYKMAVAEELMTKHRDTLARLAL